jgi:hypothetical protein
MKATLIKVDLVYHLWLNPNTKDQEHIASNNPIMDIRGVHLRKYKLSKQNCDEIFGVINAQKLAIEHSESELSMYPETSSTLTESEVLRLRSLIQAHSYRGFEKGFNKAMELNKDKQFTLEDIKIAIAYGEKHRDMDAGKIPYQPFFEFLSSLQKPTEIEVEIEMDYCYYPANLPKEGEQRPPMRPKLDENGCLILRKL